MRYPKLSDIFKSRTGKTNTTEGRIEPTLAFPWKRWTNEHLIRVRTHLKNKRDSGFSEDDWMMWAEYMINAHLEDGVVKTSRDYETVKSNLRKKIQNHVNEEVHKEPSPSLPFDEFLNRNLTLQEASTLQYAQNHAADTVQHISPEIRARMKTIIIEHIQALIRGQRHGTVRVLEQRLFSEFATLNRDFERIAITEAGEIANQGVVAATPIGTKLKRMEAYQGACAFCQSISGKIFPVVDASTPNKNGEIEIWVGKTNIGRAPPSNCCGPDEGLRCDDPSSLWWPAAGLQHSMCRGAWVQVAEKSPAVSQEFHDWLTAKLKAAGLPG